MYPWLPAQVWGAIWTLFSCAGREPLFSLIPECGGSRADAHFPLAVTAGILGGIVCFKGDFAAQYFSSQTFIPT